ncbi:phage major capsid protein [Methylocapsa acidiphila]|uniref:phage major capsid protein n=1 Tax=Methylocapsa acidiphila TaxID=133552 RepID=UPI00047CD657|nr:phage major capsid protein [Methylocapsa acidiphila]
MNKRTFTAPIVKAAGLGPREIVAIASDATLDRQGDILEPLGCVVESADSVVPFLFGHDPMQPLGSAKLSVSAANVKAHITFAPEGVSAKGDEICALFKSGHLRGVSVGFMALDPPEPIKGGGFRFKRWTPLELSGVAIPANPSALVIAKSLSEQDPPMPYAAPIARDPYNDPAAALGGYVRLVASTAHERDSSRKIEIAEKSFGERHFIPKTFAKALSSNYGASGAFLIPDDFAADYMIPLLLPRTVMRRAGAQVVNLPRGNLSIPTIMAGASTAWLSQSNVVIPQSQPAFGQIRAAANRLVALIPLSGDFLRFAGPGTDKIIGTHLAAEIAWAEDSSYIRSDGMQSQPRGLRSFAIGSSQVVTSNPSVSTTSILSEFAAAAQFLLTANVPMIKPTWAFNPATELFLRTWLDTSGYPVFGREMAGGTLLGFPFFSTTTIPTNLTVGSTSNTTEIYICDADTAIIFEGPQFELALAQNGLWTDSGGTHSAFAEDALLLRCVAGRDFALKFRLAAAMIQGATYHL